MADLYCKQCNKRLIKWQEQYCSNKCRGLYSTVIITTKCIWCGKEFKAKQWKVRQGQKKYCSIECGKKSLSKQFSGVNNPVYSADHYIDRICPNCNKPIKVLKAVFKKREGRGKFCNKHCFDEYKKKSKKYCMENNPNWKGGKSFELYPEGWHKELKTTIRKRDRFICKICGKNGYHVHHIDYNKKNLDLNNLITLCGSCHTKTNFKRDYWQMYFRNS
jgi:hypothetical protein